MAVETERRFLVESEKLPELPEGKEVKQTYLREGAFCIRVRQEGKLYTLTLKESTSALSKLEYHFPLSEQDAVSILKHMGLRVAIEKTRYTVLHEGREWVIDYFKGPYQGLCVAEIELKHSNETFKAPPWLGREVTLNQQYSNYCLAQNL